MNGYLVTWDADSKDASLCARLNRFIFGYETRKNGRVYRYRGLVGREDVRYIGQSVLFVTSASFKELKEFLSSNGIDFYVEGALIGPIIMN